MAAVRHRREPDAEGHPGGGEGHVKTETQTGVLLPWPRNPWGHQKLEEAERRSPGAFRGNTSSQHLDF